MRRILILTALILASATTWADNYLYYIYSTGSKTAQVTNKDNFGNKVTYSGDIDIPDVVTLDGIEYKVTDILPSTFYNTSITSVKLGNNIKQIHGEAFRYCRNLTEITIPASVDSIGAWAFSDCGIKNVKIEDGEMPLKLWDWAGYCIFAGNPLETVYLGRNYISNGRPFRGFTTMKSVTVSDIVTAIQSEEFRGSKGIREVKLGENITEIGKSAFYDCDTLYSITLPESVLT
ncbi:MAG: leucine-rich repeat domain-containing protein, partial [Bacteroidaceae bacterium]|nr:leucine-rich repeat domain-containing protein [Bacteroidaceae bacterium]